MALTAFSMPMANAQLRSLACPGDSVTLDKGIAANTQVCVRIYSMVSKRPGSAVFWNIQPWGNKDLGSRTNGVCFTLNGPTFELRAGSVSERTQFFTWENDPGPWKSWTVDESTIRESNDIDPCRPICLQTLAPKLPHGADPKRCAYDCDHNARNGEWKLVCNGVMFDGKAGKPKPAR
ncbi:MAG TPA: hypothetical protein VII56_18345 [Rhizomicrobium sp.]